ncbi:PREDICTED: ATG8-interacting protein 1 [Camelina sativa]|uniref:ATG8-interacting protein 1 n=1 Tax=Camelina sativa TaxID=90675 RepID=A0ABM0YVS2_CAMSA|nr:PREDICTED: ATG8-interacting protein 1 [Camelina sativa]
MANKEDHEEHPPRGNEWEVVSLTSSAYAASPGPFNVESRDVRKYDAYYGAETSRDLYMSEHFVFPPSEHENLPIDEHLFEEDQGKDGQDLLLRGQGLSDQFHYEAGDNQQSIYGESALGSSRYMDSVGSESAMYEHGLLDAEANEYAEGNLDLHSDAEGEKDDAKKSTDNLPCEAWWRRRAISIYSGTREANAIWSLFFAAAVTGLVVLGQRWQQERWQVLQLKWQSSISGEKLSRLLEPLSRLKDVIVRSNPQAALVRSGPSSEI